MNNQFIENWQEYSKSAVTAAKELEAINSQIVEKFTGKQLELANAAFEVGTKYLSSLSEVKGYQELLAEQTKLVTEFNEKLIETARGTADILNESREAYQTWLEKSFKIAPLATEFGFAPFMTAKKPATARKVA